MLFCTVDRREGRSEGLVRRIHPHLVPLRPHHLPAAGDLRTAQAHLRSHRRRRGLSVLRAMTLGGLGTLGNSGILGGVEKVLRLGYVYCGCVCSGGVCVL